MNKLAKKLLRGLLIQMIMPMAMLAALPERWLHVRVTGEADGEIVRVNLPLSLAEKVLPAIHAKELHAGRINLHDASIDDLDLRALAEAVRSAPDSEFVRVENKDETVHVKKAGGNLLIEVREKSGEHQKVDVKIPFPVVTALLSGPKDQLDLVAALRALEANGDTALITVDDEGENVRIWVDSLNTSQ
jgi:hypothetical protein